MNDSQGETVEWKQPEDHTKCYSRKPMGRCYLKETGFTGNHQLVSQAWDQYILNVQFLGRLCLEKITDTDIEKTKYHFSQ